MLSQVSRQAHAEQKKARKAAEPPAMNFPVETCEEARLKQRDAERRKLPCFDRPKKRGSGCKLGSTVAT